MSNALLQTYKNEKDSFAKHALAIEYKQAISSDNYKTDYVAVNEHAGKDAVPVFNNLVMVSEMRAFEIQQVDYKDRFSVFNTVSSSNFELNTNAINAAITEFNKAMVLAKSCDEKLKNAEEAITKLVKENGDIVDFKVEE